MKKKICIISTIFLCMFLVLNLHNNSKTKLSYEEQIINQTEINEIQKSELDEKIEPISKKTENIEIEKLIIETEKIETVNKVENKQNEINLEEQIVNTTIEHKYVKQTLNIRSGPGTQYEIVGQLNINDYIEILGTTQNGWGQILYKQNLCYINKNYLSDNKIEIKTTEEIYIETINQELNKIPHNLYQIYQDKWNIQLTSNLNSYALTDYGTGIIYFNTNYGVDGLKRSVVHELGHILWFSISWGNNSEKSQLLDDKLYESYIAEKDLFKKSNGYESYGLSSTSEYFAEAFDEYIKYPNNLKIKTPKTYELIEWSIQNLEN